MSTPGKSPMPKSKRKKGSVNTIMLPGLDKLPTKKGGKPVVVVVVKGGKNPPNLSNLPFLMGGKKMKKKSAKNKKSTKSGDKKKLISKSGEEDSVSESDRVSAPELPKAHTKKGTASSTVVSIRSDKSVTGIATSSSISATDNAPLSRTPQLGNRSSKRALPSNISNDPIIIQGGIIDRPCIPMFMLIDGPAGTRIVVPLDGRDESGLVPEGSPQSLKVSPSNDTKGYMVVEDGLLHFKPLKEYPQPPPNSTSGSLIKFLSNSNIFIADGGPKLPEEKEANTAPSASIQEKIGVKMAVSGHITILAEKGTCKFTRVSAVTKPPFYPENAAMGVLVKDRSTSYLFWIPTENRSVGPLLSKNIKIPSKSTKEMAIMGNVYKDALGVITFEPPSNKLENLVGFIMSSATGVPIYASKPEGVGSGPTTRSKPIPPSITSSSSSSTPTAIVPPSPLPTSSHPSPPISRDEISPPPVSSLPTTPTPTITSPSSPPTPSPVESAPTTPSPPAVPTGPSLGWSMLSALGSVLSTTASVISTTAGAVTEAATGAGASLAPTNKSQSIPPSPSPTASSSTVAPPTSSPPIVVAPIHIPAKVAPPKQIGRRDKTIPLSVPLPSTTDTADEEAALNAEEKAANDRGIPPPTADRIVDAASMGRKNGVTINITVRDSNSDGGKISDQKSATDRSDGESFSDALSDGGNGIGEQMVSIYRNLLSSQNELPPEKEQEQKDEESKTEEKVERKATNSISEENRRKAENIKEYKKYTDNRSVYFNPHGYR